jgi:hypothetical protein
VSLITFLHLDRGYIQKQILFNILKSRHIPDTLLEAIVHIYTQNKILIRFNNKLSKPAEINKGVRQGCPLSPTLFNVCLFSWRYNPLWLYFHSPVAGFSLLVFEVS